MLGEPDHKGPGFRFYSVVLIYLMRGIIRCVWDLFGIVKNVVIEHWQRDKLGDRDKQMNYRNGFEIRKGRMGYFGSRNPYILHSAGIEGTFWSPG